MQIAGEEKERILMALKGFGRVTVESNIEIYGKRDEKVAEFYLLWKVRKHSDRSVENPS